MFLYTSSCIIISIKVAKPKRDHERTNVQMASLRKPGRGHNFLFILNQEFFILETRQMTVCFSCLLVIKYCRLALLFCVYVRGKRNIQFGNFSWRRVGIQSRIIQIQKMLGTKPVEVSSFLLNMCLTSPRGFKVHLPDNSWYFSCNPCSLVDIIFDSEYFPHF